MKNLALIKNYNLDYSKLINYFIVLYAFLFPFSRAGVTISSIFIILFFILQGDLKNKFKEIIKNKFIIVIFLFILLSILSVVYSNDKLFAISYVKKYWYFLTIPIIYISLKKEYVNKVLVAFLLGMIVTLVFFYGISFELFSYEGTNRGYRSVFMNRIDYSIHIVLAIFISLYQFFYSKKLNWKLFYIFSSLIFMITLFVNGGRTGYFAFFIVLILLAIKNFKYKILSFFLSMGLAILIFFLAYTLSPMFKERMNYLEYDIKSMIIDNKFDSSFSTRVKMWELAIESGLKEPIFGNGIGDEIIHVKDKVANYSTLNSHITEGTNFINYHNMFVHHFSQLGLIGLFLTILLFYYLYKLKFEEKIYKNLNFIFVTISILLFMQGILAIPASKIFFGFFASIFLAISRIESKEI
ncbi:O-antigen ligase family protein [Aliarcobacter skirrowii]|uniref:O-antigen ligase family protein n=1 Tax=Aliarcobacter skirrowii TaxID=28200 RepID=UPI0029B49F38|nr:O-antigen ligase family protein [Aliarcobacter skirrowii]MDX4050977.1 O-antigen ligase family protein [Aliarcobacter skirrowii]